MNDRQRDQHEDMTNSRTGATSNPTVHFAFAATADLMNQNNVPSSGTVTGQPQTLAILHRILDEVRYKLQDEYPNAVLQVSELEDSGQIAVSLRAVNETKRALSNMDPQNAYELRTDKAIRIPEPIMLTEAGKSEKTEAQLVPPSSRCLSLHQFLQERCGEASNKQHEIADRAGCHVAPEDATFAYWEGQFHCAASAIREFRRLEAMYQWPCVPSEASEYWDGRRWTPVGSPLSPETEAEQTSWNHRKRLK